MAIILAVDLLAVCALIAVTMRKGIEGALPLFVFLVILIPEECEIELGMFGLNAQRLLLVTFFVLWLIFRKRAGSLFLTTPLRWLICAQVAWTAISTANSIVPTMSAKKALSEVLQYYLLYYILVNSTTRLRTVNNILRAVLAAVLVSSAFGAVEAYTGWGVVQLFPVITHHGRLGGLIIDDRGLRARSTFPSPILLGGAIAMAVPLAIFLLGSVRTLWKRVSLWLGIMLMFMTMYKTMSRGPWIALALSLPLLLLSSPTGIRRAVRTIGLLTISVLVVRPGVWDTVRNIFVATTDANSPLGLSYQYRFVLFDLTTAALNKNAGRALWGYGMESFPDLGLRAPVFGEQKDRPFLSCDSAWINFMVESGYVGFGLMCALLTTPAFLCLRDFRNLPRDRRYLSWVLFVTLVGYYFMMTNVAMYSWGQNGYMLWIVIAMTVVYGRLGRAGKNLPTSAGRRASALQGSTGAGTNIDSGMATQLPAVIVDVLN